MKKKCAVFTIVKNEDYFLPIWIKHYQRFFDNSDIYVLDHQSDDDSTNNLDVNVVEVINELTFDHQWLVDTVENFQSKLLEEYECVLFAEADEIIYCLEKPLDEMIDDFLNNTENDCVRAHGYEIKQNNELNISHNDLIIPNRNYWYESGNYSKTLLSKVRLNWIWGFHYPIKDKSKLWSDGNAINIEFINKKTNKDYNLFLLHLHRLDFKLMRERHKKRSKWNHRNDGGGGHNLTDDINTLETYFNDITAELKEIPEEHKIALNGL
jgi:hypothetical protein